MSGSMENQRDWTGTHPGSLVWVSDQDEAFVPGHITALSGGQQRTPEGAA